MLVALVGYTQTRGFRSSLQSYILSHYQTVLHGQLTIGNIEGNLITGIRLNTVTFRSADTSLFTADRIEFTYDPLALFFKRISLGRVSVTNPHIQLYRSATGQWNVSDILVSSSDTSSSAWVVTAKNIEIVDARISVVDSVLLDKRANGLSEPPPVGVVDYARVALDSLNLQGGFQIKPSEIDLHLRLLAFTLENPQFHFRHLQGDFKLTKNEVAATQLRLRTDRSQLSLDAALSGLDITKLTNLAELKTKPVRLDLRADDLDTKELKQFLYPWVDFLDKSVAIQIRASGEFGRLNVQRAAVKTPESTIDISGTITNLHNPVSLELDLVAANSNLDPSDIAAHVPGLFLPDLREFGRTRFRLTFKGTPSDFESSLSANSGAGTIEANAHLTVADVLQYKTEFVTEDLDLGKIFGNSDLKSSLNMNGSLTGIGTDASSASAVARIEVDSSQFWGMPIGQSAFVLDLNNAVLRAHTQLRARSTLYELSSVLTFPRGDSVSYTLNGSVNALNLADLLRNDQFPSDLSFTIKANGKGSDIGRLNSSALISFVRSSYDEVPIENGEIEASLDASRGEGSRFSFHSDPVDINVTGRFNLVSLIENIICSEGIVSEAVAHRFSTLDSLRAKSAFTPSKTAFEIFPNKHPKFVDVSYHINARNLYPVGVFFRKRLTGSLAVDGTLKGTVDSLDFVAATQVQSFVYRNQTDSYGLNNGAVSLDLKHISRTGLLRVLDTKLDVRGDKFFVNDLTFHKTALTLRSKQDSASYHWTALIDSAYQVDVRGTSMLASNQYTLNLSQLRVGMDFYIAENNDPVQLKLGRDGIYVKNLAMTHEIEELGVDGYFDPSGASDLKVTVSDFLLTDIKSILRGTKIAESVKDVNGILNASLDLKGPLSDPELMLSLNANGLRSHDLVLGQIVGRTSYVDHSLSLFIELRNKQREQDSKPDLLISGTVPYDFRRSKSDDDKPKGEINLTMFSKGINLEFLDPLIPSVANLTGTLVCDMKIRGTVDDPVYEGSISLQGARFLFKPLGIYYLAQGRLIPNGNRVGLENFVVRNIPQDRTDGQMKFSGTISLAGLKLQDLDLRADGQLLVMKESSPLAGQKFYGDLFLGTGPNGVRWQGQPSDSRVAGDVMVKSGRIIFPPERESTSLTNSTINVIFKDDTSKVRNPVQEKERTTSSAKELSSQYASLAAVTDPGRLLSVDIPPTPGVLRAETESSSFLDNISYDLNIDVQSPTSVLFIFNTQLSEQLFADLKGRLAFIKSASQTRLSGEMTLESRSYYYFFKRFDASGKIDFTGDPLNPELSVRAKYEGIHTLSLDTLANAGNAEIRTASGQRLTSERVDVVLQISGTKNKPKTKFDLEFPDRDKNSQYVSKDIDADAMSFLVTGYFKDELDPQQRGSFLTANMLSGLTAGLLTGPLTNALKKQISAIQSVDLQYYGGDWNKTDVRVTAEISSAVIRFGGRVIEGINNTNVSVEVPVGSMFGSDQWRNLLFKYERKVDAVESVDQRTQSNSLSLFYRIIF